MQSLGGESVYDGRLVQVRIERFRHSDGEVVSREIVRHRGAVGIVAHDHEVVWLVRQPREAVGIGERAARRELAEEIGRGARTWEPILSYYSSAGFTDERVHLFRATDLHEASAASEENERIEVVPWRLSELGAAIEECRDAKTLIGLLWLQRRLHAAD